MGAENKLLFCDSWIMECHAEKGELVCFLNRLITFCLLRLVTSCDISSDRFRGETTAFAGMPQPATAFAVLGHDNTLESV
jgi:hypothetical protein